MARSKSNRVIPWHKEESKGKRYFLDSEGKQVKDTRYWKARWKKLRNQKIEMNPLCEQCEKEDRIEAATDVDHIVPVRLGGKFYDMNNLQSLCKTCHAKKSGKEKGEGVKIPKPKI